MDQVLTMAVTRITLYSMSVVMTSKSVLVDSLLDYLHTDHVQVVEVQELPSEQDRSHNHPTMRARECFGQPATDSTILLSILGIAFQHVRAFRESSRHRISGPSFVRLVSSCCRNLRIGIGWGRWDIPRYDSQSWDRSRCCRRNARCTFCGR